MTHNARATRPTEAIPDTGIWIDWVETVRAAIQSHQVERMRHRARGQIAAFPPIVRRDVGGMDPPLDQSM